MLEYQREFLRFAIDSGVLRFGQFTLKSGRVSPYFFNAGLFNTGEALSRLGQYYAAAIMQSGVRFDVLYGPAYKGIPLVCAVAIALHRDHQRCIPWVFNRKEAKPTVRAATWWVPELAGRVLVIDDVITAGTAIRESLEQIRSSGAELAGVCVSIDRQEKGQGELSAIQEVERDHSAGVMTIATLETLISYLEQETGYDESLAAIMAYREQYGV